MIKAHLRSGISGNGSQMRRGKTWFVAATALFMPAVCIGAAEPAIRDVSQRGLQIGVASTLVVDGDDLGSSPSLLVPFAARQELKSGATDKRATFEIVP